MSNIIQAIHDKYEEYLEYCKEHGEKPKPMYWGSEFRIIPMTYIHHWRELKNKHEKLRTKN